MISFHPLPLHDHKSFTRSKAIQNIFKKGKELIFLLIDLLFLLKKTNHMGITFLTSTSGGNKLIVGLKNSVKKVISRFGAIRFPHQSKREKAQNSDLSNYKSSDLFLKLLRFGKSFLSLYIFLIFICFNFEIEESSK